MAERARDDQRLLEAAEQATKLWGQAAKLQTRLAEFADSVSMGELRARRFLAQFDMLWRRSTGGRDLNPRYVAYSVHAHREMEAFEAVNVTVFVD